jgi:hypothetical protein
MVTLGIRISDMRLTHAQYFFQHHPIRQYRSPQINPVTPLAAINTVINSSQGPLLMI